MAAARPNNNNSSSSNSNKFSSINFNDIFDKKTTTTPTTSSPKPKTATPTSSTSSSYKSHLASHGRMLLLSRSPTSAPSPPRPTQQPPLRPVRGQPDEDPVSLCPVNPPPTPLPSSSLLPLPNKLDRFVPPHLRPGFLGKEERPEEALIRPKSGGHDREVLRRGDFPSR
ncbi:hypothetical protein MLD38_030560 [Melastoma candidum]|uniref:Uncharacterized protein n=1 Tax=Melastoma candidum TaxID=119954 RepID=A0ACB9MLJ8_9MYRT|nr:hypothetical protein MLD38_030560 [Melastoma candidum]